MPWVLTIKKRISLADKFNFLKLFKVDCNLLQHFLTRSFKYCSWQFQNNTSVQNWLMHSNMQLRTNLTFIVTWKWWFSLLLWCFSPTENDNIFPIWELTEKQHLTKFWFVWPKLRRDLIQHMHFKREQIFPFRGEVLLDEIFSASTIISHIIRFWLLFIKKHQQSPWIMVENKIQRILCHGC